jgi:hypothetical protein
MVRANQAKLFRKNMVRDIALFAYQKSAPTKEADFSCLTLIDIPAVLDDLLGVICLKHDSVSTYLETEDIRIPLHRFHIALWGTMRMPSMAWAIRF